MRPVTRGAVALSIAGAIVLVLATASVAQGQGQSVEMRLDDRSRAELLVAREAVWRAWFANDSARLERLLPARMIAIDGGDSVWQNREQIFAGAREFAAGGGKLVGLAFPRTEMQVFGDVVVLYTTFRFDTENSGQRETATGSAVEVFVRRDGRWVNPSWYVDFTGR